MGQGGHNFDLARVASQKQLQSRFTPEKGEESPKVLKDLCHIYVNDFGVFLFFFPPFPCSYLLRY